MPSPSSPCTVLEVEPSPLPRRLFWHRAKLVVLVLSLGWAFWDGELSFARDGLAYLSLALVASWFLYSRGQWWWYWPWEDRYAGDLGYDEPDPEPVPLEPDFTHDERGMPSWYPLPPAPQEPVDRPPPSPGA